MRVEEDWEVLVGTPAPAQDLPQICTVFGPTDPAFGTHVVFELNHGTLPSFAEGGMQLQVWWTDNLIGYLGQFSPTELATPNEKITYTTVTRLHDNKLRMFIRNGTSTTWGPFGSDRSLYIWLWSFRSHLNPYDPSASIRNSRVTYGANRVTRFCRREIRFYDVNGNLYVRDNTTRYVHQLAGDQDVSNPNYVNPNAGESGPGTGDTEAVGEEETASSGTTAQ
jgi:hypothetical protein